MAAESTIETLTVLVCDDEPGMRMGVARALRDYRVDMPDVAGEVLFRIIEAETGEQALGAIGQSPPHILLLDHKLPGMSGIDVLEQLPRTHADMLTVMITAYASIETAVRATKQGAYDFLPKPFTPAELRDTVRKAARHLIVARQARRLADEKRRVRFEFISVLAHELKSPINAIEGYLNVLQSGAADIDPKVLDQIIERCSMRIGGMRKMIGDLLDLTRIESGEKRREITDVDVCDAARASIETMLPDADRRQISIELHAPEPCVIAGDRNEIEIIFNNLISNAVKYNRDGGRVDVMVKRQVSDVVIAVTDTGIGMAKEEVSRLFRDFVRIKSEKTQGILGSGLGLSILKKLCQLYRGEVKVTSEPDRGSTFTITLKQTGSEAASRPAAKPE